MRTMVSLDYSSLVDEVIKSLKRKNSQLAQGSSVALTKTSNKKRMLVKESELVPLQKGNTSSSSRKRSSSDKASR